LEGKPFGPNHTKRASRASHGLENQSVSASHGCSFFFVFFFGFFFIKKPLLLKFCENGIHAMN
jgi:hypothetical protein